MLKLDSFLKLHAAGSTLQPDFDEGPFMPVENFPSHSIREHMHNILKVAYITTIISLLKPLYFTFTALESSDPKC